MKRRNDSKPTPVGSGEELHEGCDYFVVMATDSLFKQICNKDVRHIDIDIHEGNCQKFLENIDVFLVASADLQPEDYYGCHTPNGGVFPFNYWGDYKYIKLINDEGATLNLKITKVTTYIKHRVDLLVGGVTRPNRNGDACIWTLRFRVKIDPKIRIPSHYDECEYSPEGRYMPRFFLMRWDPTISNMTIPTYAKHIVNNWQERMPEWSIYDWKQARRGDIYFMLREGDGPEAGIVFFGSLATDTYEDADWRGTSNPRHYCRISIEEKPSDADGLPYLSIAQLEKELPEIDWRSGHSGERLISVHAQKIMEMLYPHETDMNGFRQRE